MKHLKYFESIKNDYILYHPKIGDWVYLNSKCFMSSLTPFLTKTPCKIIELNDDPNFEHLHDITCKFMEYPDDVTDDDIKDGVIISSEIVVHRKLNQKEIEEYLMNLNIRKYNL